MTRVFALWAIFSLLAGNAMGIWPNTAHGVETVEASNAAANKAQTDAENLYRAAWQVIEDNYCHRDQLKDWSNWKHKFDGKLNNEAEAIAAINQMLGSLNEAYTYYKSPTVVKHDADKRAKTKVASSKMLPSNIGYIKIDTFSSENTTAETEAALKTLDKADAYVLDLRGNLGGLIHQAFEVFSLFVDDGTFTVLKGHYGGNTYEEVLTVKANSLEKIVNKNSTHTYTRRSNLTGKKPVIVLVDANSASASEMLSGALVDNGRATLVGTKTRGKGIAQITPGLPNGGAVHVTYAHYYLPKGTSIHKAGLTPKQVVSQTTNGDAQLEAAVKTIEKELKQEKP